MKKTVAIITVLLIPVLFFAVSCGGGGSDSAEVINVTGLWEGYFAGTNFPLGGDMVVTFVQTGTTITGSIQFDIEGSVSTSSTSGSVSGTTVTFSVSGGTDTTTYVGTLSGSTITGISTRPSTPEDMVANFALTKSS